MSKHNIIAICLAAICLGSPSAMCGETERGAEFRKEIELPDFIHIEPTKKPIGPSVYEDVMCHSSGEFGDEHGRPTNVHETTHGINSRERNRLFKVSGRCNAFYCLRGRVAVVKEPKLKMTDIKVPVQLRSYRYKIYFEDQLKDWNDVPTYPLDEWSAYISGAECAVEDFERGMKLQKADSVSGCLEFSIYALATAMAVKEKDPEYWFSEPNFRKLIGFNLHRAEKAFFAGRETFASEKQEELLFKLREDETIKDFRDFMLEWFGEFFLQDQ